MIKPFRATYGEQNNSHQLLNWDETLGTLPVSLLGLTDKPPAHYAKEEIWWPSVGCAALENWWALWWTVPDNDSARAGMVRSEVALWPLENIINVADLFPVLKELSGEAVISLPPTSLVLETAEHLLTCRNLPPVITDLTFWPGLLATIWQRLWPSAKSTFSARVAGSPPQGGEWVSPPTLFAISSRKAPQWIDYPIISATSSCPIVSKGAHWLAGDEYPAIDEILAACNEIDGNIKNIRRLARASENLESLREAASFEHALGLLRTIVTLAPMPTDAKKIKEEAVTVLSSTVKYQKLSAITALANLDFSKLPSPSLLEGELSNWIKKNALSLTSEEASSLLGFLQPEEAQKWWRDTITPPLSSYFEQLTPEWIASIFRWINAAKSFEIIAPLLPTTEQSEQKLLDYAISKETTKINIINIQKVAIKCNWSMLHAWTVAVGNSLSKAIEAQYAFPGDPTPGLNFLLQNSPAEDVLEHFIANPTPTILKHVAQRVSEKTNLLNSLNPVEPAWRQLWAELISQKGKVWPTKVSHQNLGTTLLDSIIADGKDFGLLIALSDNLVEITLSYPQRDQLWSSCSETATYSLRTAIVDHYISVGSTEMSIPILEPELRKMIFTRLNNSSQPNLTLIATLMEWSIELDEDMFLQWISTTSSNNLSEAKSNSFCENIMKRKWTKVANRLYEKSQSDYSFRKLAHQCKELLSSWRRLCLASQYGMILSNNSSQEEFTNRLAELGADLSPNNLTFIWERAGGKEKDILSSGTPQTQWYFASKAAKNGKLKFGMRGLAESLLQDFPRNNDVLELIKLIKKSEEQKIIL